MGVKTTFLKICLVTFVLLWSDLLLSQHLSMTNFAGDGTSLYVEGSPRLETGFDRPTIIARDNNGDIYFGVGVSELLGAPGIYKVSAESNLITLVVDNTASISGLAVKDGFIYFSFGGFSTFNNEYIYYVNPATPDVIDTLAGNGDPGEAIDGAVALESPIGNAGGLKISPDGNFLYYSAVLNDVASFYNYIQKINLTGTVNRTYRVAGQAAGLPATEVENGEEALTAELNLNVGLAWDLEENIYFATGNNKIKMIHYEGGIGKIYHVAGDGDTDYDPTETESSTASISINNRGFDITGSNQLLISDNNNYIRAINLIVGTDTEGETIETIAGTGFEDGEGEAEDDLANFDFREVDQVNIDPLDIVASSEGFYFTDLAAQRVRFVFICKNPEIFSSSIDKETICKGDEVTMSFEGDLNYGTTWKWFDEGCFEGVIPGEDGKSLTVTATESENYYVIGTGGCANNEICTEFQLDVTCKEYFNTFTPNGDGVNDFLEIPVLDNFPANTVVVYNRWGQLLEQIENYDNLTVVWTGTNGNNDPVDSGTYYFTAEANGELISSGWVQVIK